MPRATAGDGILLKSCGVANLVQYSFRALQHRARLATRRVIACVKSRLQKALAASCAGVATRV